MQTTTTAATTPTPKTDLSSAITSALKRIPPLWPLEHFVAVNPFIGYTNQVFSKACSSLRYTTSHAPLQSPEAYLEHWEADSIAESDLAAQCDKVWSVEILLETLKKACETPLEHGVKTFADILDDTFPHAHWSRFVTEEIAKWCAVHFDRNQTTWLSPWRHLSLFEAWQAAASRDAKPEAFGLPNFREFVRELPNDPRAVISRAWFRLDPAGVDPSDFFHRQLDTISGWAGHVQYLAHEDTIRGNDPNPTLLELLAIRLAYDTALHTAFHNHPQVAAAWRRPAPACSDSRLDDALARWQSAYEAGYQHQLTRKLLHQPNTPDDQPTIQAVFCIDVRSEIIRRHLEEALPGTHTLGFAGFFGFPVAHQSGHDCTPSSRCPALLAPAVISREQRPPQAAKKRAETGAWKAFQNSATSCFSFVESLGLTFSAKLIRGHNPSTKPTPSPTPKLDHLPPAELATIAENALRGMSLTKNFSRLVLLCGHGSHSANNPFGSSLECGACGGHAGDVNARLAAETLNNPEIRSILADRSIDIPASTYFIAGRHDTLSDDFLIYDGPSAPSSHHDDIARLKAALEKAGAATRAERAAKLGLGHLPTGPKLDRAIRLRGTDIAQLRPEWALANNAAFIAAPRARTAKLPLDGRVFLHEYDPKCDPESNILTAILTAPVVVASWINLQYYGSRTNPERLSAGDKTIHQVVAGIGVLEGNAGDLRNGLPIQSIHNGKEFIHEPRRLSVIIENSPEKIEAVLTAHPTVKQLFDNQWLHLISLTGKKACYRHPNGTWNTQESNTRQAPCT